MIKGRLRDNGGQIVGVLAIFMVVLCGMSALVLDVGSWFWQKRQLQATADAAALAGAQALPESWVTARTLALGYADENGGGVMSGQIHSDTTFITGDTIRVDAQKAGTGVMSRVFGINAVDIGGSATAMKGSYTGWAKGLVPWTIDKQSVQFGQILTFKVEAGDQAAPGNFGGVDLPMKEKGCADSSGGNDYYDMIAQRSHSCLVKVHQPLPPEPGNKAATGNAVKDRGAKHGFDPYSILTTYANGNTEITDYNNPNVIVIPVIKAFHQGNSEPFITTGFAWFIITDYTNKTVTGIFVRSGAPSSTTCPTASDPNAGCPFGAYDRDGFSTVRLIK
jgi:hypothetical protein